MAKVGTITLAEWLDGKWGDKHVEEVAENIIGQNRWATVYRIFFKTEDGQAFGFERERGSTEYQDSEPGPFDVYEAEYVNRPGWVLKDD